MHVGPKAASAWLFDVKAHFGRVTGPMTGAAPQVQEPVSGGSGS